MRGRTFFGASNGLELGSRVWVWCECPNPALQGYVCAEREMTEEDMLDSPCPAGFTCPEEGTSKPTTGPGRGSLLSIHDCFCDITSDRSVPSSLCLDYPTANEFTRRPYDWQVR